MEDGGVIALVFKKTADVSIPPSVNILLSTIYNSRCTLTICAFICITVYGTQEKGNVEWEEVDIKSPDDAPADEESKK